MHTAEDFFKAVPETDNENSRHAIHLPKLQKTGSIEQVPRPNGESSGLVSFRYRADLPSSRRFSQVLFDKGLLKSDQSISISTVKDSIKQKSFSLVKKSVAKLTRDKSIEYVE